MKKLVLTLVVLTALTLNAQEKVTFVLYYWQASDKVYCAREQDNSIVEWMSKELGLIIIIINIYIARQYCGAC